MRLAIFCTLLVTIAICSFDVTTSLPIVKANMIHLNIPSKVDAEAGKAISLTVEANQDMTEVPLMYTRITLFGFKTTIEVLYDVTDFLNDQLPEEDEE